MPQRYHILAFAILILVTSASCHHDRAVSISAYSVQGSSTIYGTIRDESGRPALGTTAILENAELGILLTCRVDEEGAYAFMALPPSDSYDLYVHYEGHSLLFKRRIPLAPFSNAKIPIVLMGGEIYYVLGPSPTIDFKSTGGRVILYNDQDSTDPRIKTE